MGDTMSLTQEDIAKRILYSTTLPAQIKENLPATLRATMDSGYPLVFLVMSISKNNPIKQSKLISEYEKLCGVQHGGDRKSNGNNLHLTQEDIASEL